MLTSKENFNKYLGNKIKIISLKAKLKDNKREKKERENNVLRKS